MQQDYLHSTFTTRIYKSLFDFNPDASFAMDIQGRFVLFNKAATDLTGYTEEEILQLSYQEVIDEKYLDSLKKNFAEVLKGVKKSYEVSIVHKSGLTIDIIGTSVPIIVDEQVIGVAGIVKDVTEKNKIQRELEISNNTLQNIIDSLDVCLWSCTFEHSMIYHVTNACEKIYGFSEEDFHSNPNLWLEVIHPEDVDYIKRSQPNLSNGNTLCLEYRIIDASGNVKWVANETKPVFNERGEIIRLDGLVIDIDERKKIEEKLEFMAFHDMLTNLPNRRLFKRTLRKSIIKCKAEQKKLAILFLDLDEFKLINDTLGHNMGDKLLKIIAKRLQNTLRKEDYISRLSGDEFTILLNNVQDSKQVEQVAQRIIDSITTPVRLGEKKYVITASIGISLYPDHSDNLDNLIKQADQAMYLAKNNGKNNYKFYQTGMSATLSRRLAIEQGLRQAIKRNELILYYQPFVSMDSWEIIGFEALIRFYDKKLGFISPAEFIPIAEKSGLINSIGEWVLHTSCKQFKMLHDMGFSSTFVSVNVSSKQLEEESFIRHIKKGLYETNFDPCSLKIEITESVMMKDMDDILNKLHEIKGMGIEISLDDFGTGYSSLNLLGKLPIHTLKIDQSFVQSMNQGVEQQTIIRTIIAMANSLNRGIIAEGVELEEHLNYLINQGCTTFQGYYFSKPVPFEEVPRLLLNGIPAKTRPL